MAKKKFRIKFFRVFLLIVVLAGLYYLYFYVIGDSIKNIYVQGNKILTDQEIIEQASLQKYPSFIKTSSAIIKKKLLKNDFIEEVKIKKEWWRTIVIEVKEYKILFKNMDNNKYVLSNGKEYDLNITYEAPDLLNFVPETINKKLVKGLSNITDDVIQKISEIKYSPSDYDDDLFILYMNDQNTVQISLDKIDNLNKYNEIVPELNGKTGILYLDSGNYFKIMD